MAHTSADQTDRAARHAYVVGVLFLLAAAGLWSLNGVLIKLTHDDGRGPGGVLIAFYRSLFAGVFLIPLARGKFHTLLRGSASSGEVPLCGTSARGDLASRRRIRPAAVACVVFFTLMTVCFVIANTKTEAANAIILQYTSTCWVFCLSPLLLREQPRLRDLWILGVALVGIVIIFVGNASTDLLGLLNALGAGFFYALLTMMLRVLRNSDAAAVTVLNNLGSALLILPFALMAGGLALSSKAALLLILMGVVQFGLPYYLFSLGIARVKAYHAALITLAEPILVPIWTYLALSEVVPAQTLVGGAFILVALAAFAVSARRGRGVPIPPPPG